jgi:hypothetical protein
MNRNAFHLLFGVAAAALAAAGCGGGGSPIAPSYIQPAAQHVKPAWRREAPATARGGVYIAQANGASDGDVFGYPPQNRRNAGPSCSIDGQTFEQTQIAADRTGRIYLPQASTGTIRIYAPRCGKLLRTISDPGGFDLSVAVDGAKFYAAGGTHVSSCSVKGCTNNLSDGSIFQLASVAVDHSGNVWASYYNQSFAPSLIVWVRAAMPGRVVSGYVNPNAPGGLIFDQHDNLISVETIFPFAFLYSCNAGTASCINTNTIQLHAGSAFGSLNARNTDIQITDYANDAVDVYAYPSFSYKYSYDNGLMSTYSVQGIVQTR